MENSCLVHTVSCRPTSFVGQKGPVAAACEKDYTEMHS